MAERVGLDVARVREAIARSRRSDLSALVVFEDRGMIRVADRDEEAARRRRRDPALAFLIEREPVPPGHVLVLDSAAGDARTIVLDLAEERAR